MSAITIPEHLAKEACDALRQADIDYRHAANRLLDDDSATNNIRFAIAVLSGKFTK